MNVYVSTTSKDPISEAIRLLEASGYSKDEDNREYYFQADEDEENCVMQIYCDDEYGDDRIAWYGQNTGKITPSDKLEVLFTC